MEHHVYFWLKHQHQNEADRAAFEAGLDELFKIPLVSGGFWGVPAPVMERPVIDHSWDYATSMYFKSIDDQDAYQVHPDHEAFVDQFSGWWQTVQVRDIIPK